jgi:hypothetical protein
MHIAYSHEVVMALQQAKLYINPKGTKLFCMEVDFLGHHISEHSIEANNSKVDKVIFWPILKFATQVCAFLGLV